MCTKTYTCGPFHNWQAWHGNGNGTNENGEKTLLTNNSAERASFHYSYSTSVREFQLFQCEGNFLCVLVFGL